MATGCTDKKLGRLLHLYELKLLDSEEREIFEIHLLECSSCYRELTEFRDTVNSLRHDPETKRHVENLAGESHHDAEIGSAAVESREPSRFNIKSWRAMAIAAVILLILILKPWKLRVGFEDPAYAVPDRLAVLDFSEKGQADKYPLGKIMANLLASDLSESQFVQVISCQRIADLLSMMDEDAVSSLDRDLVDLVASRTAANWIVTGSVIPHDSGFSVTMQVLPAKGDNPLVDYQIQSSSREDVFSLADTLSQIVRNILPLPDDARSEKDRPVADLTTHSAEAYAHYIKGVEALSQWYLGEAVDAFELALVEDSSFAMAYYHLSVLKDNNLIYKAAAFSENATRREQMYIAARLSLIQKDYPAYVETLSAITEKFPDDKDAYQALGSYYLSQNEYALALEYSMRALEIYPRYRLAMNNVAYAWDGLGEYDSAMKAIDRYIEIAPDEPNPYDSRGEICALNGRLDMAIESYEKAVQIKPDFVSATTKLGNLYLFKHDYDKAAFWYQRANSFRGLSVETIEMYDTAAIMMTQGHFEDAMALFNAELSRREHDSSLSVERLVAPRLYFLKAMMLAEKSAEYAVAELEPVIKRYGQSTLDEGITLGAFYAGLLAESGRFAEADSIVRALEKGPDNSTVNQSHLFASAVTAYYQGRASAAVESLSRLVTVRDHRRDFLFHYFLARALLASHQPGQALMILKKQQNIYSRYRVLVPVLNVKIHYLMGLAYEELGQRDLAEKEYRLFLDIWRSADKNIQAIKDVEEKLGISR